jgi:hypothetical protein
MGFKDAMKKAGKKKAGKKKSTTPEVQMDGTDEAVDKWLDADKDFKDAKARKAQAEQVMLPDFEEERIKACERDGEHHSSLKVNGKVTISTKNAYSAIDTDSADEIKEVVGDRFDEFFKEKSEVSLTQAALNDDALLGKLMDVVGDKFDEFFDVKEKLVPTEAYHKQRSTNGSVREMHDRLVDEGLVKPFKAAVKRA